MTYYVRLLEEVVEVLVVGVAVLVVVQRVDVLEQLLADHDDHVGCRAAAGRVEDRLE